MQVKKRLQINIALSIIVALAVALMMILTLSGVNRAREERELVGELLSSSFERTTFRNDYLRTRNERARVQWLAESEQIGRLLKSASDKFNDSEDKKTIDELTQNNEATMKLFSNIVRNRENARSGVVSAEIAQEVENRLVTQLNVKLYDKVLQTSRLRESAGAHLLSAVRRAGWSIFLVIAVVAAAAAFNSWTIGRTIINRIRLLRDGASIIGKGNLDHRIEIKGDDEFADLSKAFNTMTSNLRASYISLESEIAERKRAEDNLRRTLKFAEARTAELESANRELEAFSYSLLHDLRTPLRSISGFTEIMLEAYADKLDEKGRDYVMQIKKDSERLTRLVYDVLKLSVITRSEMKKETIDLSGLVKEITNKLTETEPGRRADVIIQSGVYTSGDPALVRVLLENLLDNAWKFTRRRERARIEFGALKCGVPPIEAFEDRLHSECGIRTAGHIKQGEKVYFVRDNGVGFNMAYAQRIFTPFQRLHNIAEFPGIGIGLASVQRIVHRHGGRIWVEAEEGKGATFFFTLRAQRSA